MSDLKTQIYQYLDQNGFKGSFTVSMGFGFNFEESNVEHKIEKFFKVAANPFGLNDDDFEATIIDYIFDTTNIKINSLANIDRYSDLNGFPFIIEIFKEGEHSSVFTLAFGTINGTLILNDADKIVSLGSIEKIEGDLKLKGSSLKSLGKLKTISGSLYIRQFVPPFTNLTSLENLEYVGGNLILKNSPITDLGQLKYVGGSLNLRKTNIANLGYLENVGEDIFLPKDKKNVLDTSKVKIGGNLKYFSN